MNKERLGSVSTPEEAGKTAPDKQPMSEIEMLKLMTAAIPFGYPPLATGRRTPTRYIRQILQK